MSFTTAVLDAIFLSPLRRMRKAFPWRSPLPERNEGAKAASLKIACCDWTQEQWNNATAKDRHETREGFKAQVEVGFLRRCAAH